MARSSRVSGPSRPRPTSHKANAAGYAKRHSQKNKTKALAAGLSDVYEHDQHQTRRSRPSLRLDKDEAAEFGVDEDGDNAENAMEEEWKRRPRLVGENDDDDRVDPEDDEEIDSDEAFEESDEERFAGFSFASSKSNKKSKTKDRHSKPSASARSVQFVDVDLNEDDGGEVEAYVQSDDQGSSEEEGDSEEEGEAGEFIDVLDVLDGRGDPDIASDEDPVGVNAESEAGESESEGSEDGDGDDDEDEEAVMSDIDAADSNPEALDKLEDFITNLSSSQKRKFAETPNEQVAPPRKRRFIQEQTTAGAEGEFNTKLGHGKLNLDDLLAPLASQSSALLSLKTSAKPLMSSAKGALEAPLPQRTQERLDREAAYEQTKEEVDKWKATMGRLREAEHLSFPLQAQPASRPSNLELTAKFKPTTELETAVDRLLKSAQMREEDIQQTEALKMNHLSVEEVAARRGELRKMRDVMFRADIKAKRVAKIKSKTFRKIKKKEREKLLAKLDVGDDEDDDEARLKREVERARERATLKHKNTGKWAKAMRDRNELDDDQRREITEMLERGDMLKRKIRGEQGSDEEDDESDDRGFGHSVEEIKKNAFEELAELDEGDPPSVEDGEKHKNIFNMKFMKDAMARGQQRVNEMADDFIKEIGDHAASDEDDCERQDGGVQALSGVSVQRTGGRVQYHPSTITHQTKLGSLASDTSSVTLKSTDLPSEASPSRPSERSEIIAPTLASNPWLIPQDGLAKVPRKKNEIVVAKDSSMTEKSKNKIRKRTKKRDEEKDKAKEDAVLEISMDDALTLTRSKSFKKSSPKINKGKQKSTSLENESDDDSEVEEHEKAFERKLRGNVKGVKAFEQRDLVALAFAGDNVVQDFQAAKRKEMEEDAPREIDTTLAGWGSWGGKGAARKTPKQHLIKKLAGIDPTSRADYNKAHVIISEKRDKKAAKYLVKDLPYPYTSKDQYERRIDTPLGAEWNTRLGFQRGTLPKVVKKMGTIIRPLEKIG